MFKSEAFFTKEQQEEITAAVRRAELKTSGEIRLFIDSKCKGDVLDRAAFIFEHLEIHKTVKRDGVLFYLAIDHRKFAILGDAGINAVVKPDFWDEIKKEMLTHFSRAEFTKGLVKGIEMAGEALEKYFPHEENDTNELADEIVFGK